MTPARESLDEVAARIADAIVAGVPGLDVGAASELVTTIVARSYLRAVDRHLHAHPDALTSGDSGAPPSVLRIAAILADRGVTAVRVPRCHGCRALRELRHRVEGGRICDDCRRRRHATSCGRCGHTRAVASRTDTGEPLCGSCHPKPVEPCGRCGRSRAIQQRLSDGSGLCPVCYQAPSRRCHICAVDAPTYSRSDDGEPICRDCYQRPTRRCGGCGRTTRVELRASAGHPDLCPRCATRTPAPCALCRARHPAHPKALYPLCLACRDAGHLLEPDLTEAPPVARRRPGETDHDVLRARIRDIISCPTRGIAGQLAPLENAFDHLDNVATPLAWIRGTSPGLQILADLASRAHDERLDHAVLDAYPQTAGLHWLRALLVTNGVLPARDEMLERVELWLDEQLGQVPTPHARIVEPFVTWHLLRQARQRGRGGPTDQATATHIRTQARLAIAFLAWLDMHGRDLTSASQGDLDRWLTEGKQTRYFLGGFISWARARGLCPDLTMSHRTSADPHDVLDDHERWTNLQRCLTDGELPLHLRVAGALILLYGRTCTDLHRLTTDDIDQDGEDSTLHLNGTPLPLPRTLADLVRALADRATPAPSPTQQAHTQRWLFPGRAAGRPIAPYVLARGLRRHGIALLPSRHAARAAWATEIPVPLAADLLGINITATERWAQRVRRDWTDYLADRADSSRDAES